MKNLQILPFDIFKLLMEFEQMLFLISMGNFILTFYFSAAKESILFPFQYKWQMMDKL